MFIAVIPLKYALLIRDIVFDHLIQFYLNNAINLRPLTPYIVMLYPQNGDSFVTIDSVTSLHPIYCFLFFFIFFLSYDAC